MEKIKTFIVAVLVLFFGVFLIIYRNASPQLIAQKRILLNTYVNISTYAPEDKAYRAISEAFSAMQSVENKLNAHDSKSEISKINKNAPKKIKVSSLTYNALGLAKKYQQLTDGYFDITVGPVISLWDFNKREIPESKKILSAKKLINSENLKLSSNNKITIGKNMTIDTGAILKGVAVDEAEKIIIKRGIKNALITTGSSTTLLGKKADGTNWKVGIQHPRKSNELLGIISASNVTISTSGDYQQFFVKSGSRYNHIINPRTGYPQNSLMSLTVILKNSAARADILSTAIFAMGREKGIVFANKNNIEYVAVTADKKIITSKGFDKYTEGEISY